MLKVAEGKDRPTCMSERLADGPTAFYPQRHPTMPDVDLVHPIPERSNNQLMTDSLHFIRPTSDEIH